MPARFHRYGLMHGWNARINQRQFALPQPMFPQHFDAPTLLVRERLTQRLGDLTLHYTAAKGETDDALWLWVPERGYLFTGDLIIWQAPNCGNPQKVQRYPEEWADALEAMAGCDAEWLFPGHGLAVQGRAAVRTVLTETARYLRVIVDEVRRRMNAGETPEDIFHAVEPDAELATRPFLRATYDHPKFIVRNLLRLWGGWWNGNAAELLPATPARASGGGGGARRRRRGASLRAAARCSTRGDATAASHLAEWATRAEPSNRDAQTLQARRLRPASRRSGIADGARHLPRRHARRAARARRGSDPDGRSGGHDPRAPGTLTTRRGACCRRVR